MDIIDSIDVDEVKVDIQHVETIGLGYYGGRVHLSGLHQKALEESVAKNFKNNNHISFISHNSGSISRLAGFYFDVDSLGFCDLLK